MLIPCPERVCDYAQVPRVTVRTEFVRLVSVHDFLRHCRYRPLWVGLTTDPRANARNAARSGCWWPSSVSSFASMEQPTSPMFGAARVRAFPHAVPHHDRRRQSAIGVCSGGTYVATRSSSAVAENGARNGPEEVADMFIPQFQNAARARSRKTRPRFHDAKFLSFIECGHGGPPRSTGDRRNA